MKVSHAHASIAAIACVLLHAPSSSAQSISIAQQQMDLQQLQSGIASGALWPQISASLPGLSDCASAREKVYGNKSKYPARDRYAAARRFEECVAHVRSTVVTAAGTQAVAAQISFDALALEAKNRSEDAAAESNFMGIAFGVGFGVSESQDELISEAEVGANGNIRALKTETQQPRVILESHYYGWCKSAACNEGRRGFGPFFGIVAKDEKLISGFALGGMYGWKDPQAGESDGFSIGLGAILDSEVTTLASGFQEGQPLPPNETEVKFEQESRWGILIFFTRTF